MASNFHNIVGFLAVGVDLHKGLQILLPPPPGEEGFIFPELVCCHPFAMGPGWKTTVLINGVPSVVNGHTPLLLWPHLPLIPENALFPLDVIFGEHSCWLPRGTVFICDEVSTCCVVACVSVNLDCFLDGTKPSDLVLQPGTVQTTPSLSDFLVGALQAGLGAALNKAAGKLGKKVMSKLSEKLSSKLTKKLSSKFDKLVGDKLEKVNKLVDKNLGKIDKLSHKIAVKATRKGLGYQAAKKLGSPFAHEIEGLSSRALSGRSKAIGRAMLEEFLKRSGLKGDTVKDVVKDLVKDSVGFDPMRTVEHLLGRPSADGDGGLSPFKPEAPDLKKLADGIPLWGKIHGGVQILEGGGD